MAKRRGRSAPAGLVAAGAITAVAGLLIGLAASQGTLWSRSPAPPASHAPTASVPAPSAQPPQSTPLPRPVPQPEVRKAKPKPESGIRVAIIFDDAGGSLEDLEAIIELGRPVTVAVLPDLRYSRQVAERAREAGLEVFLHLPVEPEDATKRLGPGGITVSMSDQEIEQTVRDGLASVPGAVGVNNHMGSKGTADERVMRAVMRVVKERRLIFVDSVTTRYTVAGRIAAELRIPAASRQVFLDNEDDPEAIRMQILRLIDIAHRRGEAVAIGHAHRQTAQVLKEMLAEFDKAGIRLVPASAVVH